MSLSKRERWLMQAVYVTAGLNAKVGYPLISFDEWVNTPEARHLLEDAPPRKKTGCMICSTPGSIYEVCPNCGDE